MASPRFEPVQPDLNSLTKLIVDCAVRVHKELGPGLLESTYRSCMIHALRKSGLQVQSEVALPIKFDGVTLESGYRIDLLVNELVIVELKAVDDLLAVHQAQLRSYLKHSGKRLGLLLNFNTVLLKDGIRRVIYG